VYVRTCVHTRVRSYVRTYVHASPWYHGTTRVLGKNVDPSNLCNLYYYHFDTLRTMVLPYYRCLWHTPMVPWYHTLASSPGMQPARTSQAVVVAAAPPPPPQQPATGAAGAGAATAPVSAPAAAPAAARAGGRGPLKCKWCGGADHQRRSSTCASKVIATTTHDGDAVDTSTRRRRRGIKNGRCRCRRHASQQAQI
jgi:hypothetical protein